MAHVYDTQKIRTAAHVLNDLAESLEAEAVEAVQNAENLTASLNGKTAVSLSERLQKDRSEILHICDSMAEISGKLKAYAKALEAVDRQLAQQMNQGG